MTDQTRAGRLGLEPGSVRHKHEHLADEPFEDEVFHSIAISLKRIANLLESVIGSGRDGRFFDVRDGGQP